VSDGGLVRPLGSLRATDGPIAGGKGANLGELVAAGFPVPDGFVVTTGAYRRAAEAASVDPSEPALAAERLLATAVPPDVAGAVREAYRAIDDGPVAVRSSATAEDLPGASFAGQQDTYLGVDGEEALLDAVRRAWASLWNQRAVAYRRANDIDETGLALAVVVQRMVDAAAAGVMFTANPVTGRRGEVVIEAAPGLGEAVVAGRVEPDRYTLDPDADTVVARQLAGDTAVLDDDAVRELARLGRRVEGHFGSRQDVEFAIDRDSRPWLVQARPITTLYPLPASAPDPALDPRIYFSVNVAQGFLDPFTPMGLQAFQLLGSSQATRVGRPPPDPTTGPELLVEAGSRLFFDLTPAFRDRFGRGILLRLFGAAEARSAEVLARLADDPRFAVRPGSRPSTAGLGTNLLGRASTLRVVIRLLQHPDTARQRYLREVERITRVELPSSPTAEDRLRAFERSFLEVPVRIWPRLISLVLVGQISWLAARWLLGSRASDDELRTVVRSAPHNPTTEMDLELWRLAVRLRDDVDSRSALFDRSPADLAAAYRTGTLPERFQRELASFLDRYGFRAVGEIDLGVPRWSEDPTHIIGALANYLRLEDAALAPDAQFARGAREAEAMIQTLLRRVRGPRRALLRFFLRRVRALVGTREVPKFEIVRLLLEPGRALLRPVGGELAAAGRIERSDDIYFLSLSEARRALAGADLRATVADRRRTYRREKTRRHIPRVLLSDGTDAELALLPAPEGDLRGAPASPGQVTAPGRVIRSPAGARIEPGEILVAPSTDPGWTPLFLTAGGLVMEIGGLMSHGAVVAREYGIPAVVGVAGATDRIATGDRVTVDGSGGVVSVERAAPVIAEGPAGADRDARRPAPSGVVAAAAAPAVSRPPGSPPRRGSATPR